MYSILLRPMIGRQLDDLDGMENYLFEKCQDIDFTSVRPPRLTNDDLNGKNNQIKPNSLFIKMKLLKRLRS